MLYILRDRVACVAAVHDARETTRLQEVALSHPAQARAHWQTKSSYTRQYKPHDHRADHEVTRCQLGFVLCQNVVLGRLKQCMSLCLLPIPTPQHQVS